MAIKKWKHYAIFFLGVLLIASSIGVGIGALQYEFQFDSKTENPSDWQIPLYQYESLSEDEQQVIDQAIDGKTFVFNSSEPIPGRGESSFANQKIMVLYPNGDTYYIFTHRIIFVPTKLAGYTAIAMVLTGFGLVTDAIRRHHFPNKKILQRL